MDKLTAMLQQLDPTELERLLQQVKQSKTDEPSAAPTTPGGDAQVPANATADRSAAPPPVVPTADVCSEPKPPGALQTNEEKTPEAIQSASSADVPLADLFAPEGTLEGVKEEDREKLREEKLKKEAERALERERLREEKLKKEAEKTLERERAQEEKLKREAEKALEKERLAAEKARKELERLVLKFEKDEEKERQKLDKEEERDAQKLFKDAEREHLRLTKETEKEQARLQKLEEARQAAASRASAGPPTASLSAFGFVAQAAKQPSETVNRLFPPFVPDKRIVPVALRLWQSASERERAVVEEETSVMVTDGPAHKSTVPCLDEESSLMHPPVGAHLDAAATDPDVECSVPPRRTFNDIIEGRVGNETRPCPCAYHTHAAIPVGDFDSEVVFTGFYAIGYDPCQSRPPYFGTLNHLQEGNLHAVELLRLGRFPVNQEIPRLSTLDYEYDSGDDWDVLEDDEDIAASSNDSDDALDSLDSSDLDFIDDDDDDSDPDCELQRKVVEARQRRMHRLTGKDKLIPSYSGPFVGVRAAEHPLSHCDSLDRFKALDDSFFEAMLETELSRLQSAISHGVDSEAKREQKLMEAALKNRREMMEDELEAMHRLIAVNSKVSPRAVAETLHEQHLCVGVARAEITRTVKRFYERKHGMLVRREIPWAATDDRLFMKSGPKKKNLTSSTAETTDMAKLCDNDADDDNDSDADHEASNGNTDGAGSAPSPSTPPERASVSSSKSAGLTILEFMDRKRQRDDPADPANEAEQEVTISVVAENNSAS